MNRQAIQSAGAPVAGESELQVHVDLDVLRGWREQRDPRLCAAHALPPLARLIHLDERGRELGAETIHGPDVVLGRFHPQYGPVDVVFETLRDWENYRLGAPHLDLALDRDGQWSVRPLAPEMDTHIGPHAAVDPSLRYRIEHGDELRMGVARFVFERLASGLDAWLDALSASMAASPDPALLLMRAGGICGPRLLLEPDEAVLVGRSFPGPGELPDTERWFESGRPDWDLAGLVEKERKHIGFRHACLGFEDGRWMVEPVSRRQRVFVNRQAIAGPTPLESGDEIGLGNVLFHFHAGGPFERPRRGRLHVPADADRGGEEGA